MAAVLVFYIERERCECCGSFEHGRKVRVAICRAGVERLVNNMVADGMDVGHTPCAHTVEIPRDASQDLTDLGWQKVGRAWVCPEHATV